MVDKLLVWAIFGFLALVMIMALCVIVDYLSLFFSEIRYEKERRMQNINEKAATKSNRKR